MLARIEEQLLTVLLAAHTALVSMLCVFPSAVLCLSLALTHSLYRPTQFQTVATTENEPADRKGDGRQLGVIRICQRAERARWYLPDRNNVSI
jgi:hypothetical protein